MTTVALRPDRSPAEALSRLDVLPGAWLASLPSINNRAAYRTDLADLARFCAEHDLDPLGATRQGGVGMGKEQPMRNRVVVFDLPFPLLMSDLDEAGEIEVAGTPPAGVGLQRRMNERAATQSPGILQGGDPYGRVTYTRVHVRFHVPLSPEVLGWDDEQLIATAVAREPTSWSTTGT